MERNIEALEKEGRAIAEELGNGVAYMGPWFRDGGKKDFFKHIFNDDPRITDSTFTAGTLEEAKRKLIEKRKLFGAPSPNF